MTNSSLQRVNLKLSQKLTHSDVVEIKGLLWRGYSQAEIARSFGVTQPTISRICVGAGYSYIPWPDGTNGPIDRLHYLEQREYRKAEEWAKADKASEEALKGMPAMPHAHGYAVAEQDPKKAEYIKEIEQRAAEATADMEGDTVLSLSDAGEPGKVKEHKTPKVEHDKLDWDYIKEHSKPNRLLASGEKNELTREAICIVYKKIPQDKWNTTMAEKLVDQIRGTLENIK